VYTILVSCRRSLRPRGVRWSIVSAAACAALVGCDRRITDESAIAAAAFEEPWFEEVTAEFGIVFIHDVGATGNLYLPELMGGGVAVFDADNNGRLDLYFIQGNRELPHMRAGPQHGSLSDADALVNRFYRQRADGTFEDATAQSGLADGGYGMGVAIGDIDNSGFLDVFVTNFGPDQLYRNRGDGTFENITAAAGIDIPSWSCSAAFVDVNRSGWLDLYVTQYLHFVADYRCYDSQGRLGVCPPNAFTPVADVLLRNNGDGTFIDISERSGIASFAGAGLGVVCDDFNDDGWQDIYVANDGYANNLWINQTFAGGRGPGRTETFVDRAVVLGVAFNMHGRAEAGMGVIAADLSNTLTLDLFMTHLTNETNTFYRSRGDGTGWEDVTTAAGLALSSMPHTGFGVVAIDTLLRGALDIIVANGRVSHDEPIAGVELSPPWDEFAEPNLYYLNQGSVPPSGIGRFSSINGPVSAITGKIEISRGLALGDLDGDGRLDIVVANLQGPPRVYRNVAPRQGRWLMIEAVDPQLNRHAYGARVYVSADGSTQMRTVNPGYSYLSSCDPRVHFGLGNAVRIDWIDVHWPDGLRERFVDLEPDRIVRLIRGQGAER
jgi:enediyne biosynthesis protein E4